VTETTIQALTKKALLNQLLGDAVSGSLIRGKSSLKIDGGSFTVPIVMAELEDMTNIDQFLQSANIVEQHFDGIQLMRDHQSDGFFIECASCMRRHKIPPKYDSVISMYSYLKKQVEAHLYVCSGQGEIIKQFKKKRVKEKEPEPSKFKRGFKLS